MWRTLKSILGILVIWLVGWIPFIPISQLLVPPEHRDVARPVWILSLMIVYIVAVVMGWAWPNRRSSGLTNSTELK